MSDSNNSSEKKNTVSIGDVRQQLSKYGQQLNSYLRQVDANVENYKFLVEKAPEGISIAFSLKATINTKS
jgi:hypothetical protein